MAFITIDGENKIALKQGLSQVLNVSHFVLANISGLGSEPVDRIEAMPAPGDIVDILPVSKSGYVNPNQVVYSLALDSTIGDYTFNWVGIKDSDDVLIAVIYLDVAITKTATSGGIEGNNLVRNFLLQYSGIQATTAISAPASTWQIDFTTRLLQIDVRERLSNLDIYGHEGFFDTGFSVVRQGVSDTYDILPGIGYVGGIRIESDVTQQIVASSPPESIWLDVSLQGDINGVSAIYSFVVDGLPHADYTDGLGFTHYLTKLADLNSSGVVTDNRISADVLDDHLTASDPHAQYLLETDIVSQADAEAGTATIPRSWTAQRVKQAIIALATVNQATETVAGKAEVATQAETDAGSDDARMVTAKKLRWGFSTLLADNGYIVFPSWLGGLILQWRSGGANNNAVIALPIVFPANHFITIVGQNDTSTTASGATDLTLTGFKFVSNISAGADNHYSLSIGN